MSLIYNILLLIGMNKRVKQYVVSNYFKSFNSNNVFIRLVCLLFILAAIIISAYLLYRAVSNALYMYGLKTDFNKLQNMGLRVKNFNVIYCKKLKKKYIPNQVKLTDKSKKGEFKNKNVIGIILDKYVILDIDTKDGIKNADFLKDKLPKDTVLEKTPNGYHYYFENDTGNDVYTYVQLEVEGEKYAVDILGKNAIVITSPSIVNDKKYYWINSIFTHTPAKLSENMWILDLIKNNKPFNLKFDKVEFEIKSKNAFIIIDNLHIENFFRYYIGNVKKYDKKINFLGGFIYIYDGNYYFMSRGSFYKYKNKNKIINNFKNIINELRPSCIIDLSIVYTNYMKGGNVLQIKSAIIDNNNKKYKNNKLFPDYIEQKNVHTNTKYLIKDTISIHEYDNSDLNNEVTNIVYDNNNIKQLVGPESIYITMLLSNEFNIPSICIGLVSEKDKDTDDNKLNKDSEKKIMTTFLSIF